MPYREWNPRNWLRGLLILTAGCGPTLNDRMRLYNEDGVERFAQGDYREARESFELALTLEPRDPALLFNLAQCYDRLGDAAKAEQYYLECLQRSAGHADARLAYVNLLHRTGRGDGANRLIEDWLKTQANAPDAYVLDAWRLRQQRNFPQAQARLQQALALDPHHVRALTELGVLFEATGRPEFALTMYERALAREPNQPEVVQRLEQLRARGIRRPLPEQ